MAQWPRRALEWLKRTLEEQPLLGQSIVAGLVLVVTVLVGAVIGTAIAGGGGAGSGPSAVVGLRPAVIGELIPAASAEPAPLAEPRGMGSRSAGVAIVALSRVDSVDTGTETRRAPEGSRMLAFRVGDWTCAQKPCGGWGTLSPVVSIDGQEASLVETEDTYVVVVPPGTDEVLLQIDADGYSQSLSLLDDSSGQNIELLARDGLQEPVMIQERVRLAEQTSIPLTGADGQPTSTFIRTVSVGTATRQFFVGDVVPSAPQNAFLIVTMAFTYDGQTQASAFDPAEIAFVLGNGRRVPAVDLDPSPEVVTLAFEIPASAKSGTLQIGGTFTKVSTTNVSYTTTLMNHEIPVDLG